MPNRLSNLPAEPERVRRFFEGMAPEVSGIANEDELKKHAVDIVLTGVRADILRELEEGAGIISPSFQTASKIVSYLISSHTIKSINHVMFFEYAKWQTFLKQ